MEEYSKKKKPEDQREVLVFLHYFGGAAQSWDEVIKKLSDRYRCIAISFPGFGGTPAIKKPSIQNFASFVQEELSSLGIKNYSLIGHSMGGKIAMQIAANDTKNAIRQLILVAPSPPTTEPLKEKDKELMLRHTETGVAEKLIKNAVHRPLSEDQFTLALKTQLSVDPDAWKWWILEGMNHSIEDNIWGLNLPITVLASNDDPVMTSHVIKERVMPWLNQAKLITTKEVGHLSPLEVPGWIADQIKIAVTDNDPMTVKKPTLLYWHVWTDEEGVSHQTQCSITSFEKESMGNGTDPQWNNHLPASKTKVLFSELPVGWVGNWHENPKPQWIIPLSGHWYVETMDGHRVEMGPGEVSFGADQNTKPNKQERKGHLSGTIGQQPVKLMIVQLTEDKWKDVKPGEFS